MLDSERIGCRPPVSVDCPHRGYQTARPARHKTQSDIVKWVLGGSERRPRVDMQEVTVKNGVNIR